MKKKFISGFQVFSKIIYCFFGLIIFYFSSVNANACTNITLHYNNQSIVGQNFDWPNKYAYLLINPAGVKRESTDVKNKGMPLQWVSKYGSATIVYADKNKQVDKTAVLGGINQYGLSGSILWLDTAQYSKRIKKPELGTTQWVQYFLDNAKTVAESIKLAQRIDIEPTIYHGKPVLVHLIVHDAAGNSAVMENINGKLVIYQGKNLPLPILTNDFYQESIQSLKQYKNFGGNLPLPGGHHSKSRFILAAYFLQTLPTTQSSQQAIANTFDALGYLSQPPGSSWQTGWSAVYDLSNKVLYYRDVDNQQIRFVRLNDFDLSAGQAAKLLFMNNNFSGNVKKYFHDEKS